jgi:hypothetical protein
MLVVIATTEIELEGVRLWALIKLTNDLCAPYQLGHENVFYRHEFRDATTRYAYRCPAWNRLVQEHSVRAGVAKEEPTDGQLTASSAGVQVTKNPSLKAFMNGDRLKKSQAEGLLSQVKAWDIPGISEIRIYALSRGLHEAGLVLSRRSVGPFLVEGCWRLGHTEDLSTLGYAGLASAVLEKVETILKFVGSMALPL